MKTIMITGAAGGIGAETAKLFAAQGYEVLLSDLRREQVESVADEIRAKGGAARAYAVDIADADSVDRLFSEMQADVPRLDAAFNNAGLGGGPALGWLEACEQSWVHFVNVNLSGTFRCMQREIAWMKSAGGGAIVNNASIFGLVAGPNPAYTACKHGIVGLTKSAARNFASNGIRVNAVCPGLINAGMGEKILNGDPARASAALGVTPMATPGTGMDVAETVHWLCSDGSRYIQGHAIPVDGGYVSV